MYVRILVRERKDKLWDYSFYRETLQSKMPGNLSENFNINLEGSV